MIEEYNLGLLIKDRFVDLVEGVIGTDDPLVITKDGGGNG